MIRWQVRKAAPFRIEDAQVSWIEAAPATDGGGREYLVLVARRDIVESYERACDAAGVQAGIVDIVSTNLVNAVLATDPAASVGRLAAGEHRAGLLDDRGRPRWPGDLLPEPAGRRSAARTWAISSTRRRCTSRTGSAARRSARVVLAGGSDFEPALAERGRRQIEERLGVKRRAARRPKGCRRCATALRPVPRSWMRLAPAVGVLLRDLAPAAARGKRAGGLVLRTNLSTRPFYNDRAIHVADRRRRRPDCRAHGLERHQRGHAVAAEHRTVDAGEPAIRPRPIS